MNTRFTLFLLFSVASVFYARSQNIKIKNGTVIADDQVFVNITDETPTSFTITSVDSDSELVYLRLIDPTPTQSNAEFDDRYYLLRFPDFDREAVVKDPRKIGVIKLLYSRRIITDGRINKSAFKSFITQYGIESTE